MARKYSRSDSDLVAAALSTLTDNFIVSQREHDKQHKKDAKVTWKKHDITIGHSESIQLSGASKIYDTKDMPNGVFVHDKNGQLYPILVDISTDKVTDLKSKIQKVCGVCVEDQSLIYGGEVLKDTHTLNQSYICNQATLFLTYDKKVPVRAPQFLHDSDLAPAFNFDLTYMEDDGVVYRRGGMVYRRPYGWNRIALNVLGRYRNDTWLGTKGVRARECPGEWMVSFHGVMELDFLRGGDKIGAANRVHSTPNIDCIEFEKFIKVFEFGGEKFKAVFQNRVNPLNVEMTKDGHFICDIGDIRPYGVCVKKIV